MISDIHSPTVSSAPKPADAQGALRGAPHPYSMNHAETNPEVIARLEWLDDLMFAAIDGDPVALEAATHAWRRTVEELGGEAVEESRRQYLRRAQTVWNALRLDPNHASRKTFAAIEVISLLAGRVW